MVPSIEIVAGELTPWRFRTPFNSPLTLAPFCSRTSSMGFSVPRAEVGVSVPSHTPVTSTVTSVRSIQSVFAQALATTRATPMTTHAGLIRLPLSPGRRLVQERLIAPLAQLDLEGVGAHGPRQRAMPGRAPQ